MGKFMCQKEDPTTYGKSVESRVLQKRKRHKALYPIIDKKLIVMEGNG